MKNRRQTFSSIARGASTVLLFDVAAAQGLPVSNVGLIVPLAAEGGVDVLVCPFAIELGKALNCSV